MICYHQTNAEIWYQLDSTYLYIRAQTVLNPCYVYLAQEGWLNRKFAFQVRAGKFCSLNELKEKFLVPFVFLLLTVQHAFYSHDADVVQVHQDLCILSQDLSYDLNDPNPVRSLALPYRWLSRKKEKCHLILDPKAYTTRVFLFF